MHFNLKKCKYFIITSLKLIPYFVTWGGLVREQYQRSKPTYLM